MLYLTLLALKGSPLWKSTPWRSLNSIVLGSGTSGGVLAPLLIIGGALGAVEARWLSLGFSLAALALSVVLWKQFNPASGELQFEEQHAWIPTLAVQYQVSNQSVGREFFRAHKTITHTGELLQRGMAIGSAVLTILVLAVALWAFRLTHRIVRPVHTLHRALEALVAGDLGVRIELHRDDEFHEVAEALNRLVDEFASTLGTCAGRSHGGRGARGARSDERGAAPGTGRGPRSDDGVLPPRAAPHDP